jgi:hypothetical protein
MLFFAIVNFDCSHNGFTICTLPGAILIQIVYLFFCVFHVYSVLLSTDFTYSRVPGNQGGPMFFRQEFFLQSFYVQIGLLQFVS